MHSLKILAAAAALSCLAAAQTATHPAAHHASKPAAPAATSAEQNPHEPVITIDKLCVEHKPGAACKTVITKAEFERLLGAVRPNLPPAARLQIAKKYVQLLTFADKAEQAGLEKAPEFQEQMRLMRMQALATAYTRHVQEKYAKPSDAEIEKYYQDNKPAFEEITLKRIYIPKPVAGGEKKPALDEAATKQLADKIQARAAAGEDFDKLQAEAFAAANPEAPKDSVPPTSIGVRRRGQLPPAQETKLFELKAGEVSPLMEEPSGFFIYKVESKQVLPLDKVKDQIGHQLEEQKMRDAMEETLNSVQPTFNESYFKAPAEEEAPHGMPGAEAPAHPPAGAGAKPQAATPPAHAK